MIEAPYVVVEVGPAHPAARRATGRRNSRPAGAISHPGARWAHDPADRRADGYGRPFDLLLAYDVSWRSIIGPRPWVQLCWYSEHAHATALALEMIPAPGRRGWWYLTERTPDLAEAVICKHVEGQAAARVISPPLVAEPVEIYRRPKAVLRANSTSMSKR